jgi:hypothetical protein
MVRTPELTPRESARTAAQARWGPARRANFGDLSTSLRGGVVLAAVREAEAATNPRAAA